MYAYACKGGNKMINTVVIVGKVAEPPEIKETAMGNKVCSLLLEVQRNFPNSDGIYVSDYIPVTLWKGMADEVINHSQEGTLIGIKGRLQTYEARSKAGNDFRSLNVIAENITYLS